MEEKPRDRLTGEEERDLWDFWVYGHRTIQELTAQRDRAVRAMHTLEQSVAFTDGDWTELDAVLDEPWARAVLTRPQSDS